MHKTIGGRPAAGQARFARLKPEFVINKYYLETLRYLTVRRDECAAAYTIGRLAVSAVACILARSLYIKALSVYRRCDVLSAAHRVVERPYDLFMLTTIRTCAGPNERHATRFPMPSIFTITPSSLIALQLVRKKSAVLWLRIIFMRSCISSVISRSSAL